MEEQEDDMYYHSTYYRTMVEAEKIEDLIERLEYIKHRFKRYKKKNVFINGGMQVQIRGKDPIVLFETEIRKLKAQIKNKETLQKIEKTKPKAKGLWSLRQRYQLLEDIGIVKSIQTTVKLEDDKHFLISQMLCCDITNARKLFTGKYDKGELNEDELLKWTKKFKPDKS